MTRTLNIPTNVINRHLTITDLDTPVVLRTNAHRGPSNFQRFASLGEMIERIGNAYQGDWIDDDNEDVALFLTAMRALDGHASWSVLDASGLEAAEAAADALNKAQWELYKAIEQASIDGHSLRAIADVVGMSHEKVRQILDTGEI